MSFSLFELRSHHYVNLSFSPLWHLLEKVKENSYIDGVCIFAVKLRFSIIISSLKRLFYKIIVIHLL